jgi:hypothetical protein
MSIKHIVTIQNNTKNIRRTLLSIYFPIIYFLSMKSTRRYSSFVCSGKQTPWFPFTGTDEKNTIMGGEIPLPSPVNFHGIANTILFGRWNYS